MSIGTNLCERCEGTGKAYGADRPFESDGTGNYPGKCPVCKEIGLQPAHPVGPDMTREPLYPDSKHTNMYGCLPCPKCGSKFRWPSQDVHPQHPSAIICDDCGHVVKIAGEQ